MDLVITLGDPNGIGPEIILKALTRRFPNRGVRVHLVGDLSVVAYYLEQLRFQARIEGNDRLRLGNGVLQLLDCGGTYSPEPGKLSEEAGYRSLCYLKTAVARCKEFRHSALVTAPVSKEALWQVGFDFPGQTEFLSSSFGRPEIVMMLIAGSLRIGFATTHIPLARVAEALSSELIEKKVSVINRDLEVRFGIRHPKIAVAALNPHGGEHGHLGDEEVRILEPAIAALQRRGLAVDGPFPSDTLFTRKRLPLFDAILALFHDQGMIPIKMASFGSGVNYTAGLPIVRTSPDHGTAFDIAGRGVADESSMVEAIQFALSLAEKEDPIRTAI